MTDADTWQLIVIAAEQAAAADALCAAVTAAGYIPYDAFGSLFPPAYRHTVRTFVSPTIGAWTRILGQPDPALIAPLSLAAPLIAAAIHKDEDNRVTADAAIWYRGQRLSSPESLSSLASDWPDQLTLIEGLRAVMAWRTQPRIVGLPPDADEGFVPRAVLPTDAQAMLDKLDKAQTNQLFGKMAASIAGKLGGGADAARAVLQQHTIDWTLDEPGALAAALSQLFGGALTWRDPDFVTVRDAYQLHVRRRNKPTAPLYPGDAEALAAVPNALDYLPVYAGK